MVIDSILPHAESGSNDHRKDAPQFINTEIISKSMMFGNKNALRDL